MTPSAVMQVAVRATDLDRSTEFYRDRLGLPFVARFDPPGLVFLRAGSTRVLLTQSDTASGAIYYQVDDIDAFCEALQAKGVELTSQPHMIFRDDEGQFGPAGVEEWMAFCEDPDGNVVGIVERRAA